MSKLYINEKEVKGHINPEIYGHFAEHLGRCIYEGLYVGEDSEIEQINGIRQDVVAALRDINIPVLRWPGGCFADEYHWKDGIGPKETRKKMVNTHWGNVVEDNSFGTHEFFELCRQLDCKAYVNGNLGSGTVQEMSEWVEYMTFEGISPMADLRKANGHEKPWKVDYFGVGNENWGCGGNMTPQYYANEYRRYQTYIRNYQENAPIKKICGGPNMGDYYWTTEVLKTAFDNASEEVHGFMDGLSVHYYVHPDGWSHKVSATEFDADLWYQTLDRTYYMEELIVKHSHIMDQYDPEKKIGMIVDEWGSWYEVEPGTNPGFLYQQNTMRDALIAGITLNIFNKHCDRVTMANLAQMVNVLQAVILTEGKKMILTPTYHIFHMYQYHQDATLLASTLEDVSIVGSEKHKLPSIQESVSMSEDGTINITITNLSLEDSVELDIQFMETEPKIKQASIVAADKTAHNTFEEPERVVERSFQNYQLDDRKIKLEIPACSVILLRVENSLG